MRRLLLSGLLLCAALRAQITILDSSHGTSGGFPGGTVSVNGKTLIATSSTSWTPAITSSQLFNSGISLGLSAGQRVMVISDGTPTAYGIGTVVTDTATSLTLNINVIGGTGAHTDWDIYLGAQCSGANFIFTGLGTKGITAADAVIADFSGNTPYVYGSNYVSGSAANATYAYFTPATGVNDFELNANCPSGTCSTNGYTRAIMVCLSGVNTSSPIHAYNGMGGINTTSLSAGNVATDPTDMVLTGYLVSDSITGCGNPPTGYTMLGAATAPSPALPYLYMAFKQGSLSNPENPNWNCGGTTTNHSAVFAASISAASATARVLRKVTQN